MTEKEANCEYYHQYSVGILGLDLTNERLWIIISIFRTLN